MNDEYWGAVHGMRTRVAELLESLDPAEWDAPSLCAGWRVRDVAGHVSIVPTITTWQMVSAAPRARFNPNRINTLIAVRHGSRPPGEIVARLRDHAGARRTAKILDTRDALFDIVVHSQDIAIPLGREVTVPVDYSRQGLERGWEMGWPFKARRRLSGLTLRAIDTEWCVGTGPEVVGPALALLLVLTGRAGAVAHTLEGAGVSALGH